MRNMKRILSLALALCCVLGCMTGLVAPASAAEIADATIDMDQKCTLDLYKYDWTNATKDGVWASDSYVSTGKYDANVNKALGDAVRKGDSDKVSNHENGKTSNGYAVAGVEFTYLKVAEFMQFSESENDGGKTASHVEFLYKFDKTLGADLLKAIGLAEGAGSYANANALNDGYWCYQSDVLVNALRTALTNNPTTVKNALEAYVTGNGGTAMPLTDEDGWSHATELPVGLYLIVETKVPEMAITANPFFVSLPMTTVTGGSKASNYTDGGEGGHAWNYNVTVYPKNETGIVTLEKTVREAKKDTATHGGATDDIADGYKHYATASAGDTVNYQIISTLPTITSTATYLSEYTFKDVLAKGLDYDKDGYVTIEIFSDAACKNLIATWKENDENEKFTVEKKLNKDKSHTMTITMTKAGLAEINTANTAETNNNDKGNAPDGEHLYAGYSNYTMRITYDAVLNSDESMVYGDEGNCNEVVLTWRRSSADYYDTLIDDCHVYSYGINLTKTFSDGKDEQAMFDHVLFKVQNSTDGYYVIAELNEEEGIWYVTGHTDKESAGTPMHPVTWNEKKGQLVIKGLEDDTYILTEIETANSYTLLKEDIEVAISAAEDASRPCGIYDEQKALGVIQNDERFSFDGGLNLKLANIPQEQLAHNMLTASATVDSNAVTMLNDEMDADSTNALAPLTVVNTHGFDLPQTGQTGAKWMPVFSGTLIGLSAICLFIILINKRREEDKDTI